MGAFLCIVSESADSLQQPPSEFSIDLKDPRPAPEEEQLYKFISQVLQVSDASLDTLRRYKGCGETIRAAISRPSPETEQAAWAELGPAILQLKGFYDHSIQLGDAFPRLLEFFGTGDIQKNLESNPATAKKMADLLHFVSQFDELKMNNSNLQNDFSFYRRSLQKVRMHGGKNSATGPNMVVDDVMANNMSMFYAQASPMARVIIDCCVYQKSQKGMTNDKILQSLTLLSAVCYNSVRKNIVQGKMVEYCLRVLVMCVVLYDNICTSGSVFMRGSRINIPAYVKLIQSTGGPLSNTLMNSMRYSTIHLNDDNTPESIRNLVMS